jgi:hypothetical protein
LERIPGADCLVRRSALLNNINKWLKVVTPKVWADKRDELRGQNK